VFYYGACLIHEDVRIVNDHVDPQVINIGFQAFSLSHDLSAWTRVYTTDNWITSIVVNPVTRTIVLAADERRNLYRSDDGGLTWTATGQRPGPGLAFNPFDANIVHGSDPGSLYRSTDGGNTWDPFCSGLPTGGS
jgi:hypothetical protein